MTVTGFSGPLEDRIAIRELFGMYADVSARGDREGWISLWAEDGHWTSHLFDAQGHDALRATWDGLWAGWENAGFLGEIGMMRIDGERAEVRSYAREVVLLKDGGIYKLVGRYDDVLRKQGGAWRFAARHYTLLSHEPPAGWAAAE